MVLVLAVSDEVDNALYADAGAVREARLRLAGLTGRLQPSLLLDIEPGADTRRFSAGPRHAR